MGPYSLKWTLEEQFSFFFKTSLLSSFFKLLIDKIRFFFFCTSGGSTLYSSGDANQCFYDQRIQLQLHSYFPKKVL